MTDRSDSPSIGLVGCGRWGSLILRDLRSLGARVDVMVPSDRNREELLAAGASRVVTKLDELQTADGIVVASPTVTHADVLDTVVDFGVPVFVEKPMTCDAARAADLAARAPDRLFVMDKWRYHAGVLAIRDRVAAGDIGTPQAIRTRRVQWGSPHDDVDCTWILLPHDISIAYEVLGSIPEPVWARAFGPADRPLGLEGAAELPDGVWMHFRVGITSPEHDRRIEVVGDDGSLVLGGGWDEEIVLTRTSGAEADVRTIPAAGELPLLAELRTFVDHLAGGPPPLSSAATGAAIVGCIAAARDLAGLPST
ncbi:MAG: Gfo/Idh/MocA family oxidoreductase [Acidimicrobiales bacterium]|nr:Gfo/Idh/MocA family oxidoreductase [Acidimicrobiales bacterium]